MKKRPFALILLLAAVFITAALSSCVGGNNNNEPEEVWTPTGELVVLFDATADSDYVIVYKYRDEDSRLAAVDFGKALAAEKLIPSGTSALSDAVSEARHEVLFGATDRKASAIAGELLAEKVAAAPDDLHCVFYYMDGRLAIVANSERGYDMGISVFMERYCSDGKISFPDTLNEHVSQDINDYEDSLLEDLIADNADTRAEHDEALGELLKKIDAQRKELISSRFFGTSTKNIGKSTWGTAPTAPSEEHPRLLLNNDTLPEVKRALTRDDTTNSRLFRLFNTDIANDCILPAASYQGTNSTVNKDNYHNFNEEPLEVIQAKALAYLLYDDPYYGYQAIYYIKNYLKSLDIVRIASDQCRQYGYVMYTAAIVYDWCYPLLTELDKEQIIAGVENRICRYSNQSGRAMAVGFPPSKQQSVTGHGAERQILRDYLSFSVAIYGDNNSWWDYVAARVYNDFIPMRNYYYESGSTYQGTGYAAARYTSDLFSAWIILAATGENPYNNLAEVTRGLVGLEVAPGMLFNSGDKSGDYAAIKDILHPVTIAAYLEGDATLLAQANDIRGTSAFSSGFLYLTSAAYAALRGLSDPIPEANKYEGLDLIQYNGSPLGQYVAREAFGVYDSAAIFMRIKERATANHEHSDAGTFEIYYKGALSTDGGCYDNYDHAHTQYFHQATISHNGLIIYNPALAGTQGGWYSGGQRKLYEADTMEDWLRPYYDAGRITGREHAYTDASETKPLYAYVAGDITASYDSQTVDYVGRRMLTVFTGDESAPMVLFVYDDITSDSAEFEKRFLLQISSQDAPTISGNTVITEKDGGRLMLTCLSDSVKINGVGGRTSGNYVSEKSQNYLINGKQLVSKSLADDGHWGRIEIVWDKQSKNATFLNVIAVTDAGNDNIPTAVATEGNSGIEGAVFGGKIAALFATDRSGASALISCTVSGGRSVDYYVSGVAAGDWIVNIDGQNYGVFTATEEGRMLTFTAPAGRVVLSPAK